MAALIKKGCCGRAGDRWWGKRGNPCGLRRHGTNSKVKKDEDASTHLLGLVEDGRKQSSCLRQVQEVDNNGVGRVFAREKKRKKPMTPWSPYSGGEVGCGSRRPLMRGTSRRLGSKRCK
jgi:hypothetical protein